MVASVAIAITTKSRTGTSTSNRTTCTVIFLRHKKWVMFFYNELPLHIALKRIPCESI